MVSDNRFGSKPHGLSRRGFVQAVGATLAVGGLGSLAACGSGKSSGSSTKEVSFIYLGTAEQQKVWSQLFGEFRKQHPEIALKATGLPVDNWAAFFDKVSTQIAGGVSYDLVQVATEGMQLFASRGLLHPLDDFIAKDKQTIDSYLADAHPNLARWNSEHGSPDGKTYFLPGDFNTMCLWFNKQVFQKAGVDQPGPEWTWDDFARAGRAIKAKTGAFLYPATDEYFIGVMPWLLTNGASTMSADWKQGTCATDQAVAAAEFVRQLVVDELCPPPGGSFDRFTLAVQGKLACFGGGRWPIINIRQQNAVANFGIVPWPRKVGLGSPVGWNTYPILKASRNKDAAWTFVKFLISSEGSGLFARLGGTIVPARRSIATSAQFTDDSPAGTANLYQALDYATPIPAPAKGNLIQRAVEDTWGQIISGNVAPKAGMAKMQQQVSEYL
jgi:multiple sugar transport system substrate-binding protein